MVNSKIQNLMVRRANEDESGFTLIELLIVMIIIGVLAAIAIPAFLNQQKGARDTQTTSDVRNAAIAAQSLLTQYPDAEEFVFYNAGTAGNPVTTGTAAKTAAESANGLWVGASGTTARERVTLSAGTEITIRGQGVGVDGFRIAAWNTKGKNFTSGTAARIYDSNTGGIVSQPGSLGG